MHHKRTLSLDVADIHRVDLTTAAAHSSSPGRRSTVCKVSWAEMAVTMKTCKAGVLKTTMKTLHICWINIKYGESWKCSLWPVPESDIFVSWILTVPRRMSVDFWFFESLDDKDWQALFDIQWMQAKVRFRSHLTLVDINNWLSDTRINYSWQISKWI